MIKLALKYWYVCILLLLCGWLSLCLWLEKRSHVADLTKVQLQTAKDVGAVRGELVSEKKLNDALTGQLKDAATKLELSGAHVVEHVTEKVTIHDTVKAHPVASVPGADLQVGDKPAQANVWEDEYHRFHLDIPSGLFTRTQKFTYEAAILIGTDRTYRFVKSDLREYDPVTGIEIPAAGVQMAGSYQFTQEGAEPTAVSRFHPIVVAGVNGKGAFGGGVQFLRFGPVNLAGMAYYQDHSISPQLQLGYRLNLGFLKTNLSVGVAYAPIGGTILPAASLELSK